MDLKQRLLEFLANLPSTDSPNERKALVLHTGLHYLAIYVDWQGSNVEFFTGFLEVLGAQDQRAAVQFLDALAGSPQWISMDRKQILTELRDEVSALNAEQWKQQFGSVAQPARQSDQAVDTEMLSTTIVKTILVPYIAKGSSSFAEQIGNQTNPAAGAEVAEVAGEVWERVKQAFGDATGSVVVSEFEADTASNSRLLIKLLKQKLDQDHALAQALSELVAVPQPGGNKSAVQIIADTVGYVDAQGATISGGIVAGYIGNVTTPPAADAS